MKRIDIMIKSYDMLVDYKEKQLQTEVDSFKKWIEKADAEQIVTSASSRVRQIEEYGRELNEAKEQRHLLETANEEV